RCGVSPDKIFVVKNGVHLHQYVRREKSKALLKKYKLAHKFIVAYIGTHGMAQNLGFILDCAAQVKNDHIHFLFIGEGAFKSRLVKKAEQLKLKNVTLLDAIPKAEVAEHISIADVALVNLIKKKTFTKVLPSKIFENAAMGKPILLGVEGEAKQLIESYRAGLCYEPENRVDFLLKLEQMYVDKEQYEIFEDGCLALAENFDRKRLANRMFSVLVDASITNTVYSKT
ncbi:MAG: glycosyltransferase family 4 protein, partial [Bacteroidota bacterium]